MKSLKRILVICVSLCMILTSFGAIGPYVTSASAASYTNINFDFNYNKSPVQTMRDLIDYKNSVVNADFYKSSDNRYRWIHPGDTVQDLREVMESQDPEDTYISLTRSIEAYYGKTNMKPIVIKSDKVLDLNGRKIYIHDDSNKVNGDYNYAQTQHTAFHFHTLFEIEDGATLTIIDSSDTYGEGTGLIKFTARMIDPYDDDEGKIRYYTTRDIFWVNNGNLVIYGGRYQAGRSKVMDDSGFTWSNVKKVIGQAVELGVNIASYASGIDIATAQYSDIQDKISQSMEKDYDKNGGSDSMTKQRTGEGAKKEEKVKTPTEAGSEDGKTGREKTVSEKQSDKDSTESNSSNGDSTAKDDKNTQLAKGRKEIVDKALDKTAIENMVDGVVAVCEGIAKFFRGSEESKIVEQVFGTCVHVGADGTFVCYDGKFEGYGSSPNVRNAVVELVRMGDKVGSNGKYPGGLAYIYGGTFEGKTGANIFNIVRANNNQERLQTNAKKSGATIDKSDQLVTLNRSETAGLEEVLFEKNGDPIDTRNISVRAGTFRNYYEYNMLAIMDEGGDSNFKTFVGTPGTVNLGVTSYGVDMIKDGRIQITDTYGDGSLVLMDENKSKNDEIYHYRLFCGDNELREKTYLQVRPNTPRTPAYYSFRLKTTYDDENGNQAEDLNVALESEGENVRDGAFSMSEKIFTYPLDLRTTKGYYVTPYLPGTNVYGDGMYSSETWFYRTPKDTKGNEIDNFRVGNASMYFRSGQLYMQQNLENGSWEKVLAQNGASNASYAAYNQNYKANMKWFTYKVYRVDPLTRENISEDSRYGSNKPLLEAEYGDNNDGIKGRIYLYKLEQQIKEKNTGFPGFQSGDMYRIELEVKEYMKYGYDVRVNKYEHEMEPAVYKTSMIFECYSKDDLIDTGEETLVEGYTPLQWVGFPYPGVDAYVQLKNGQAGKVDFESNKIFDVYYQWYVKNDSGEDTLIAGTTNVYKGSVARKKNHIPEQWKIYTDGHEYKNTLRPNDPKREWTTEDGESYYDENIGLPRDPSEWTAEMIHMYSGEMYANRDDLKLSPSYDLDMANNRTDATSMDRCYIPKELSGKTIYCKATVVNVRWKQDFDFVQVFYSRPYTLPKIQLKLEGTMTAEYDGEYITKDNPLKMKIDSIKGLSDDEYVNEVVYCAFDYGMYLEDLNVKSAKDIPAVEFPKDFYPEGYDLSKIDARHEHETYAYIYTNKGRWIKVESGLEPLNYEVEVQKVDFNREQDVIEIDKDEEHPEKYLTAYTLPANASVGWLYKEGDTFTATDPSIATLNDKGELVIGNEAGSSSITLKSPDGNNRTIRVEVTARIPYFEVFDISPPEVGKTFDLSANVPTDANYYVDQVYWTKGKSSEKLSSSATCQDMTVYNVNVVLKADSNFTFLREPEFRMTVTEADGNLVNVTDKANHLKFEDNNILDTVTLSYRFMASVGMTNPAIEKVYVDFPEVVREGDGVEDWEDQVRVYAATGGNKFETIIRETKGADAVDIVKALGYSSVNSNYIQQFIRGVQTGPEVRIFIPDGSAQYFADDVKLYLNGELAGDECIERYSDDNKTITVTGYDLLTIQDGDFTNSPIPKYNIKDFNLGVGDKIYMNDLLEGETSNVELVVNMEEGKTYNSGYYRFVEDEENGDYIEALKASPNTVPIYIEARVNVDNAGRNGMRQMHKFEKKIQSSPQAQPSNGPVNVSYNLYYPDGKRVQGTTTSENGYISLPTVEGAFWRDAADSDGNYYDITLGPDRIYVGNNFPTDAWMNIHTISADTTDIYASDKSIIIDTDCEGIMASVDGEHWTAGPRISGLKPDTQYTVYYRQGLNGTIYSTGVKTSKNEPDLYVRKVPVTRETPGNLEKNGWEYDADTRTLTIENLNLYTSGFRDDLGNYWGTSWTEEAAITSNGDLTIRLVGSNEIDCDSENTLQSYGIYCKGDLTLEGNGDLTIAMMGNILGVPVECEGNIYLKHTGNLEIDDAIIGFQFDNKNHTIYYENGEVDYNGFTSMGLTIGKLVNSSKVTFDFNKKVHDLSIKVEADESRTIGTSDFATEIAKDNFIVHIDPQHNYNNNDPRAECLISGDCETGAKYYSSCTCGHIDYDNTFTTTAGSHSYKDYAAKAATCVVDGWEAYKVCEKCGKSTFKEIKATGHKWVVHDEIKPTCTTDGYPGYAVCSVCDTSTEESVRAQFNENAWKATGHHVHHVAAKAATCTKNGHTDYYKCDDCGKYFKDEDAIEPISASATEIPAMGHKWDTGVVTKQPTATKAGEMTYTCQLCGKTRVETLSVSGVKSITPKVTLSATSYVYNGKQRKPTVTVKDGTKKLTTSDYTVKYASGRKNVGKYSVKVTLKGNYAGSKTVYFKINPKGTTLKSLTGVSKGITVKWNKQSGKMSTTRITGYEIWLATNSTFTKNKKTVTVKGYSNVSKKVTKLKAKTKYYVKIRTYKTINGTKYYSKWSKALTAKTKA